MWWPEGLREADAHLLGRRRAAGGCSRSVPARRCAPGGCARARCGRRRVGPVGRDARRGVGPERADRGRRCRCVQADATALPFAARRRSTSCSPPSGRCRSSPTRRRCWPRSRGCCARAGGCVFSTTHPVRWAFPDVPGPRRAGRRRRRRDLLRPAGPTSRSTPTASRSTSSTTARWATGSARSPPPGLRLVDLVEPEWPRGHTADVGRVVAAAWCNHSRHGGVRLREAPVTDGVEPAGRTEALARRAPGPDAPARER